MTSTMGSIKEIMQFCRLCLVKDQVNVSIFEEHGDTREVKRKITACLPVTVSSEDKLPKKICDGCLYKLELLYQFRTTCVSAEKQLQVWINELNNSESKDDEVLKLQDSQTSVKQEIPDSLDHQDDPEFVIEQQISYEEGDIPYNESQDDNNDGDATNSSDDEPLAKRRKRLLEEQAQIAETSKTVDDHMAIAKLEHESDDDENVDDPEPNFVSVGTSDEQQPGPSGLNKMSSTVANVEMPTLPDKAANHLVYLEPQIMRTHSNSSSRKDDIPSKSSKTYNLAYKKFITWCNAKRICNYSEKVLLVYFSDLVNELKWKSPTLWSQYSMLRTLLKINHSVDISKYIKLRAYLKNLQQGYTPKKSKLFTQEEFDRFLDEAPDDQYLGSKTVLIIGIAGTCNCDDMVKLTIDDVKDLGESVIHISLPESKTNKPRSFTIIGEKYIKLVRKYVSVRPHGMANRRLFLKYQNGKCMRMVMGIHTIGRVSKIVATFLKLPGPQEYTGYALRLSPVSLLASGGVNTTYLKRDRQSKPSTGAKEFIQESMTLKIETEENVVSYFPETSLDIVKHESEIMKIEMENETPLVKLEPADFNLFEFVSL